MVETRKQNFKVAHTDRVLMAYIYGTSETVYIVKQIPLHTAHLVLVANNSPLFWCDQNEQFTEVI